MRYKLLYLVGEPLLQLFQNLSCFDVEMLRMQELSLL